MVSKVKTLTRYGKVYPKRTLFLRVLVGTAKHKKYEYEMSTSPGGSPMIESKQTGKYFSLSWAEIITMAVQAGIDNPQLGACDEVH